jgi:hypothetical protein
MHKASILCKKCLIHCCLAQLFVDTLFCLELEIKITQIQIRPTYSHYIKQKPYRPLRYCANMRTSTWRTYDTYLFAFSENLYVREATAMYQCNDNCLIVTDRRDWVVNNPGSYSRDPGFKSRSWDPLPWLSYCVVFLSHSRRMPGFYLKIRPRLLPSKSFSIHHSLITLSFDAI